MRNAAKNLPEIAEKGGLEFGVQCSAYQKCFRKRTLETLLERINKLISLGITTIEIKSGYGLNVESELKNASCVIQQAQTKTKATLVPTCLSAHLKPRDFEGIIRRIFTIYIVDEILPKVKEENLAQKRVDIFIENLHFNQKKAENFRKKQKIRF